VTFENYVVHLATLRKVSQKKLRQDLVKTIRADDAVDRDKRHREGLTLDQRRRSIETRSYTVVRSPFLREIRSTKSRKARTSHDPQDKAVLRLAQNQVAFSKKKKQLCIQL